jgi:hypothetical protein
MSTKSQELLTKSALDAADNLRKEGWKQKEYLSAGVIALLEADPVEKVRYKTLAYNDSLYRIAEFKRLYDSMTIEDRKIAVNSLSSDIEGFISITKNYDEPSITSLPKNRVSSLKTAIRNMVEKKKDVVQINDSFVKISPSDQKLWDDLRCIVGIDEDHTKKQKKA